MKWTILLALCCCQIVLLANSAKASPPDFPEFRVAEIYRGKTHFPDFKGRDKSFKDIRTALREGMNEGPKFAGSYSVVQIGCGTQCNYTLIVSNRSGQVFTFPLGGEGVTYLDLAYRLDSSLMIARWSDWDTDSCYLEYFKWTGKEAVSLERNRIGDSGICPESGTQ